MSAIDEIADAIVAARKSGAHLRIGKVTAVQSDGARAQIDFADLAWVPVDKDVAPKVNDRVYVLQQGPVLLVCGLIGATPETGTPIGALTPYGGLSSVALPTGWLFCEGQAVSRTDFAVLFARLGTTYGAGNGSTTFNLPDLRDRIPVGQGARGLGATGGASTVTLSTGQMPSHQHASVGDHQHAAVGDHSHWDGSTGDGPYVTTGPTGGVGGWVDGSTGNAGGHQHSGAGSHQHGSSGSGQSHENMPPFVVVYYIIRVI